MPACQREVGIVVVAGKNGVSGLGTENNIQNVCFSVHSDWQIRPIAVLHHHVEPSWLFTVRLTLAINSLACLFTYRLTCEINYVMLAFLFIWTGIFAQDIVGSKLVPLGYWQFVVSSGKNLFLPNVRFKLD